MNMKSKEWYRKWWGIIIAILILPFFVIWYAWVKSKWSKNMKIGATAVAGLFIIIALASSSSSKPETTTASKTNSQTVATQSTPAKQTTQAKSTPAPVPTRQVEGTATTVGAGTFTGGKDVAVGLYDVTPGAGQSGNFMVSGTDSYNEILGNAGAAGGVPKVRVQISQGDKIEISSLSSVTFTPVTTPFSTSHTTTALYTGTFTVGEDIGEGRYVATPGAGESGNFIVSGSDSYNEILGGDSSLGGVPSLTVNLSKGDTIEISSLSTVTFTPSN